MESALHAAWAASYDAWMGVPGHAGVIYNRPGAPSEGAMEYPDSVLASHLFAIMAWNPMGLRASDDDNDRTHKALITDIRSLPLAPGFWVAPFFGFSENWREPGFVVACPVEDTGAVASTREAVLALAAKYQQGAIYEYTPVPQQRHVLLRKTVHCLSSPDVDADVFLVQTSRPDTPMAEPHVDPN
ncbi:hypothetical protein SDRG_06613 [Saprolegnia diclina VS20]|uniref:DUF3293 domain-containing protein n=1 Tax=Saprolegnia diclina (strain VS20) TaxID=1156394 RepID=T0RTM4_SAPDV|nr:hypothetical protein SDRG_06613 [Saprolegnia diclina VS20]EQC35863.1 hypothetical protein SDRG_06613 [Saprolegnia diclina VS20]|eukprot:XP_008610625.1 hypothetical protein SDRG_06613 [Saprolegnia diclina VS20]